MNVKSSIMKVLPKFILSRMGYGEGIGKFAFENNKIARDDIKNKYNFDGDMLDIFADHHGSIIHKWHHYIPIYDRYFSAYRGNSVKFLEIGVSKGGSLEMWRKYFGKSATIYGIDIDPNCAQFNGAAGQVRIGSQDDPAFLASVIKEMGGVDVVLDDGSHRMDHIQKTFNFLFPQLNQNGLYMVEDLHTAYWVSHRGRYGAKSNFFGFVSGLVDDMHHWYHLYGSKNPHISNFCSAIHIHDSIAVFEKAKVYAPTHSQIGG